MTAQQRQRRRERNSFEKASEFVRENEQLADLTSAKLHKMLILLIVLILLFGGGGFVGGGHYRTGGIGIGTILLIVLIIMLLRGGL